VYIRHLPLQGKRAAALAPRLAAGSAHHWGPRASRGSAWGKTARLSPIVFTSGMGLPADGLAHQPLDVLRRRDRRLLEREAVRHGHLRAAESQDRRVEVVEAALLDARGQLGGDPESRPAFLDYHRPRGPV